MKKLIEFRDIVKQFDKNVVLKGVSLDIYENEFVTLLGPSGCGKTTLLRILGGFLDQDKGEVYLDGKEISKVPAYKRPINTVFQKYALFPHLNVYENVAFGLKLKKMDKKLIDQKVKRMISLVGLEGKEKNDVTKLSGGQQQRVAIARALVNEPDVLLLDEPLSALDAKLRKEMQQELKNIQRDVGITFIFVTHDQEEALTMSDKIVVINNGGIEQVGTPTEIYNEPVNEYVARFIGQSNIMDGVMKENYLVNFDDQDYSCVDRDFKENEKVDVLIRPEDIQIKEKGQGKMYGVILSSLFKGVHYEYIVETKKGASKTIKLHVLAENEVKNEEANEAIHASDFTMDKEDVKEINEQELIGRANAQAWTLDNNEDVSIDKVEYQIDEKPGRYQVKFSTSNGTSVTINVNVVEPKVVASNDNIGIQAFDVYKTVDEIRESMAISVDLITWADAYAWNLSDDSKVEIDDVRFDFEPNEIEVGDYDVTFLTEGRTYKVHTTKKFEEDEVVSLDFGPDDIHVMSKMVN